MDLRFFEDPGIGGLCSLPGKKNAGYLEIDKHGIIAIPEGIEPSGFHLVVAVPEEKNVVVAQRNLRIKKGFYHQYSVCNLGEGTWTITKDIPVIRMGQEVWTPWKHPNRIDCWIVRDEGRVDLFQVGIVTHDNGRTFRLLGEYRWKGQLFSRKGKIVGKPDDPCWGSFIVRREILDFPDFNNALRNTIIATWIGKDEELNPLLDQVSAADYARIQWYSVFAGQAGQGPVVLFDGSTAWVHGIDILDLPDPDGIKRLHRNDLVSYSALHDGWGTEKNGSKLLCVRKV